MWTDTVLTVASLEAAAGHLDRHLTYKPAPQTMLNVYPRAVLCRQYTTLIVLFS